MSTQREPGADRPLSPVSRRVFLAATPAALAAGAATLGACGGGGYGDWVYADCIYCDFQYAPGFWYDYVCCDGTFYCDGFCA